MTTTTAEILDIIEGTNATGRAVANAFGGYDLPGSSIGETIRVCVEDETLVVHTFVGGKSMLLNGSMRLSGGMVGMLGTILRELA